MTSSPGRQSAGFVILKTLRMCIDRRPGHCLSTMEYSTVMSSGLKMIERSNHQRSVSTSDVAAGRPLPKPPRHGAARPASVQYSHQPAQRPSGPRTYAQYEQPIATPKPAASSTSSSHASRATTSSPHASRATTNSPQAARATTAHRSGHGDASSSSSRTKPKTSTREKYTSYLSLDEYADRPSPNFRCF